METLSRPNISAKYTNCPATDTGNNVTEGSKCEFGIFSYLSMNDCFFNIDPRQPN